MAPARGHSKGCGSGYPTICAGNCNAAVVGHSLGANAKCRTAFTGRNRYAVRDVAIDVFPPESVTTTPPEGALPLRVTVPVELSPQPELLVRRLVE